MSDDIKRYACNDPYEDHVMDEADDGKYVLYSDHQAALAANDRKWRQKVEGLIAEFRKYEKGGASAGGISDIAKGNGLAWKKAAEMLQELLEDSQ